MKKFKQLMEGLPPKKIVFAFGRFQPPTIGHELLVKTVKKIAGATADHVIYASRTQDAKKNPLAVERKVYYLKRMFPGMNFAAANDEQRTFMEVAAALNKKYKHIVMVAGSDRIADYKRLLNTYNGKDFNYDSIEVVSAGERDPDADDASGMSGTKMREAAKKGDFQLFKTGLPHTITDLDARRLMNEIRKASGLQPVKESLNIVVDELREKYFKGEIFNVGDIVTCNEEAFSIVKRGSNHLLVKAEDGSLHSKWIHEVQVAEDVQVGYSPKEITFGGYTTKNFHHHDYVSKAFEMTIKRSGNTHPQEVLEAIKATDTYMGLNDVHIDTDKKPNPDELEMWILAHERARMLLEGLNEFVHHQDYWHMHLHELQDQLSNFKELGKGEMQDEYDFSRGVRGAVLTEEDDQPLTSKTLKPTDKIKVARVIAAMLGVENPETMSNPDQLVNTALRKLKSKTLNPDSVAIVKRMLDLADDVGIDYDEKLLQSKLQEEDAMQNILKFREFHKKDQLRKMKRNYQLGEEQMDEAAPFKDLHSAVKYASDKVKTHRDHDDGIEVYKHKSGGYDVNHTMNANGRNALKGSGAKHLGTVRRDQKGNVSHNIKEERADEASSPAQQAAIAISMKKAGKKPKDLKEDSIDEAGPFSYGAKPPKKGSIAYNAMMKRKEQEKGKSPIEPKDQMVGVAKLKKEDLDIPVLENEEMWAQRVIDEEEINNNALPLHADAQFPEGSEDFEEMTDEEIDAIVNSMTDEDILNHAYDDEELALVDADTGEEIEIDKENNLDPVKEAALMEVLSRIERIKARARFKRTESKRERRMQVALRKTSDTKTINNRARRMAIKTIKQRLAKKPLNKLSVAEKERLEQRIQRMKPVLNRIAMRMAPRVRRLERDRLRK